MDGCGNNANQKRMIRQFRVGIMELTPQHVPMQIYACYSLQVSECLRNGSR